MKDLEKYWGHGVTAKVWSESGVCQQGLPRKRLIFLCGNWIFWHGQMHF